MSYYASGYGNVVVKNNVAEEELRRLYQAGDQDGTVVLCGESVKVKSVEDLLKEIALGVDALDELNVLAEQTTAEQMVLEVIFRNHNYHEEDVYCVLDLLAPITIAGDVEFSGEDDSKWKFHFENGSFVEYGGCVMYDCDIPAMNKGLKNFTQTTELHAVRNAAWGVEEDVAVRVYHKSGLDVLSAIDDCMTAWYKTPGGKDAWIQSSGDYNIGDWLCGNHPCDDFTAQFGFILDPGKNIPVIELDYDRVLGHVEEEDDEE